MLYQVEKTLQNLLPPAANANNSTPATKVLDCQGYRYAEIYVIFGATDIGATTLKIQESDVKSSSTALTSPADISQANGQPTGYGTVVGTDNNDTGVASTLPDNTYGNKVVKFEIDLRGRKRYLLPVITIGNGTTTYVACIAELSRGENIPGTAAAKNAAQVMRAV